MSLNSTQLRSHLRRLTSAGDPNWKMSLRDYALALYDRGDVSAACLQLQDGFGADVCELLWLCWLTCHGLTPDRDAPQALASVRRWQAETTRPLRELRRRLKPQAVTPELQSLRATIKHAELQAERETLRRLQHLSDQGRGIRLLRPQDPALSTRLLEWLPSDDEGARQPLAVLEACIDRPVVES